MVNIALIGRSYFSPSGVKKCTGGFLIMEQAHHGILFHQQLTPGNHGKEMLPNYQRWS